MELPSIDSARPSDQSKSSIEHRGGRDRLIGSERRPMHLYCRSFDALWTGGAGDFGAYALCALGRCSLNGVRAWWTRSGRILFGEPGLFMEKSDVAHLLHLPGTVVISLHRNVFYFSRTWLNASTIYFSESIMYSYESAI